jgi:hypothetical protein
MASNSLPRLRNRSTSDLFLMDKNKALKANIGQCLEMRWG